MSGPIPIFSDPGAARGLLKLIYRRHAVRSYRPDPVSQTEVRLLLDAAVHAPTAGDQEPWQFVVVQNRATLERLSDRAKQMARSDALAHGNLLKPPGASSDGVASPMADPEFNIFYDAGTLVLICGRPTNEFVVADCWMAAENLMLAATAEGLGTCCIGVAVPVLNTPEAKAELKIPADVRFFAPITVGVPVEDALESPRHAPVILDWVL
jgi:nitroreductase